MMPRKMAAIRRRIDSSPALSNAVRSTKASVDTVVSGASQE